MKPAPPRRPFRAQDLVYRVPGTRWDEALPVGDGCFGAMMYEEDGALQWTLNHLDLYHAPWNIVEFPPPKFDLRDVARRAEAAHRNPRHPAHQHYAKILYPQEFAGYGTLRRGARLNLGGNFRVETHLPLADTVSYEQRLDPLTATVETRCRWKQGELRLRTYVAHGSRTLVIEAESSAPGLVRRLALRRVPSPYGTAPRSGSEGSEFWFDDTFKPLNPKLSPRIRATVAGKVLGGRMRVRRGEGELSVAVPRAARKFVVLLTIVVGELRDDSTAAARRTLADAQKKGLSELRRHHLRHWRGFWERSRIELSDRFLERLWHLNLYALACSNGEGARWKAQAAGLNGLWDVKNPGGWGSCWYWDVNIQETYWSFFTANHLELARPFHEGLREYVPAAKRWAREFYKMRGIAADFPLPFSHCVWPWCCQYLWWGWRYSMDESFLREAAWPVLCDVLVFFEDFMRYDRRGRGFVFPSVSPEQGPLGPNPTILLASLRYLLRAGIAASERLGEDPAQRRAWRRMLARLRPLPTGSSVEFGETFLDSEWASPTLPLAHPGLLMPIYPLDEIGPDAAGRPRRLARNTMKYVEARQAIGTFNFGWLSGAASRLGLGDEAERVLYEKGIAHLLRPNGLMAEETDRYLQNCHVLSDPLYHPPMVECCGGIVGAVNEMLLQSRDGKVRVFPAAPSSWTHARFHRLLAEGAWEISAEWCLGRTTRVEVRALAGGLCRLVVNGRIIPVRLSAGGVWRLAFGGATVRPLPTERPSSGVFGYVAPSRRRVFLGKDARSEYLRVLDGFLYDYQLGDLAVPRATKYKFDFGPIVAPRKDYARVIPQQLFHGNKIGPDFYRVDPRTRFTPFLRYGWEGPRGLGAGDRRGPDDLRRDFVGGRRPSVFCLELPRGQYQLLLLAGDATARSWTEVEVPGAWRWRTPRPLRAGEFALEVLPLRVEADSVVRIHFRGARGHPWRLNALMVNRVP
ncbi:MAG: glycoside hydrolase N-terminal domain-containing protein [Verrucomicrobiae bacterium]|nr:glycoside hydrolase N-terminal domain-containing protein [Verrucomicrobiae bacterium]